MVGLKGQRIKLLMTVLFADTRCCHCSVSALPHFDYEEGVVIKQN